jgi:hypothetical protein
MATKTLSSARLHVSGFVVNVRPSCTQESAIGRAGGVRSCSHDMTEGHLIRMAVRADFPLQIQEEVR